MKIVFLETDTLGNGMEYKKFEQLGEIILYGATTQNEVAERIKNADVVVLNKLLVNERIMADADHVKLICVTATGTNNVDFEYTRKKGITVTNVKGYSTHAVVQHTFALYFYLAEHLSYYNEFVKSGKYANTCCFTHIGKEFHHLSGLTWGIVGLGEIGRGVASIAKVFGCHVIYYSTSGKNINPDYKKVEFDELIQKSDVISIHAPLTNETENLFGIEQFNKMKQTSYLINVGRGPIINEKALKEALNEGKIAGVGLDVFCTEPMDKKSPLLQINDKEKLVMTPHIAWASVEARQKLLEEVALNINAFFNGKERNVIFKKG